MFLFYVQNIARINHEFVGLVVILFTLTKLYDVSSTNFRSWNLLIFFFQRENLSALKQIFPCVISLVLVEKSYWYPHENVTVRKLFSLSFLPPTSSYSTSDNETPPTSRVLIGRHWFFADWRHHRPATRFENVRQSSTRRGKRLSVQLSHKHPQHREDSHASFHVVLSSDVLKSQVS